MSRSGMLRQRLRLLLLWLHGCVSTCCMASMASMPPNRNRCLRRVPRLQLSLMSSPCVRAARRDALKETGMAQRGFLGADLCPAECRHGNKSQYRMRRRGQEAGWSGDCLGTSLEGRSAPSSPLPATVPATPRANSKAHLSDGLLREGLTCALA